MTHPHFSSEKNLNTKYNHEINYENSQFSWIIITVTRDKGDRGGAMKKTGHTKTIENPEIGKEELEHPADS